MGRTAERTRPEELSQSDGFLAGPSIEERLESLVVGGPGFFGPEVNAAQDFVFSTIDDALGGVPSAVLGPVNEFFALFDTCPDCIGAPVTIPGRPFLGPRAASRAFQHLERFHGVDPKVASNRLHVLKRQAGLGPADDAIIGRTGDVYNPYTGERLGSLTDPGVPGVKR